MIILLYRACLYPPLFYSFVQCFVCFLFFPTYTGAVSVHEVTMESAGPGLANAHLGNKTADDATRQAKKVRSWDGSLSLCAKYPDLSQSAHMCCNLLTNTAVHSRV